MSSSLTGKVVKPGDNGWEEARLGFGTRFDYDAAKPQSVVFAQSVEDVVHAVNWANTNKVPVRVRSGRHNYEGFSSLVAGGIVIDVSDMATVSIDREKQTAQIGAGIQMLQLTEELFDLGFTLPMATGPTVGLGGLVQGGGFGLTTRRMGLICDCVYNFQVVLASGKVVEANAHSHPDLFWALRGGGGGNFGVVTRMDFNVHPLGMVGVFNVTWQWSDLVAVVDKWQRWNFNAHLGITSLISLHVDGTVKMEGLFAPDPQDLPQFGSILEPMLVDPSPISVQSMVVPALAAARLTFGVDPTNPEWAIRTHEDHQLFKSTSAIASEFLPVEAIELMKSCLEAAPPLAASPSQPSMIQLLGGGGKASEIPSDATAVFHRDAKVVVQYDGYWTVLADAAPTIDWVVQTRKKLLPYASDAYVNYADTQLGDDYLEQYFRSNLPRLKQVKRVYDPENFFNFPQSIPVG